MVHIKPQNEVRPETDAEEFDRLYPPGSELRRVKVIELNNAGIPVPGEIPMVNPVQVDLAEFEAFKAWQAAQKTAPEQPAVEENAVNSEAPSWRNS